MAAAVCSFGMPRPAAFSEPTKEHTMKNRLLALLLLVTALPIVAFAGPVNINTADAQTLSTELKGIGLSKAKAIVEYREKYGPFKSPDDLTLVKGIGDRTVELNRDNIKVTAVTKK
jgi:competence protein ComEA